MSTLAAPRPFHYDSVAIGLHWGIAFLILLDFAFAVSFGWFNPGDALFFRSAYPLHMSTGLLIIGLSIVRVGWRLAHRLPSPIESNGPLQALARLSHALLYGFIVIVPFSGWLVLSMRRQVTSVFGLFSWAWPTFPAIATMTRAGRQSLHDVLLPLHIELAYAGMVLVAVHVAAALYHHAIRRDDALRRMLPARGSELIEPTPET
jgi:cytochrome b561